SNDVILADSSVMCLEDTGVFVDDEYVNDDTFEDLSEKCNQDIIPSDSDRHNNDFETYHIDNGKLFKTY
ncbi:unnamed protein product, partial [Rotaria magnacalcarata]